MPEFKELAAMVEAVLAVAGEPVTLDALAVVAGEGTERSLLEEAVEIGAAAA
jgi:chromosome segregation and condensation protein ScpB